MSIKNLVDKTSESLSRKDSLHCELDHFVRSSRGDREKKSGGKLL